MRFVVHEPSEISLEQVAMNPTKIKELAAAVARSPRLLLVSGPSGSSKTTAIRALLRQSGKPVREYFDTSGAPGAFGEFLVGCALLPNAIVLVDELPNLSHGPTLDKFREALEYWSSLPRAPMLVVVFTETEGDSSYGEMLIVPRVFGSVLAMSNPNSLVEHIKCLAISPRFLAKALKSRTSNKALIDELSQLGDIRQAIQGLEMPVSSKRDTKTSIFHRIGQVVWASKHIDPLSLLDRDEYDQQFAGHVFENYAECGGSSLGIRELAQCSEYLSLDDAYDLGVSSYALHTIIKGGPSAPGRFHSCVMSQQRKRNLEAAETLANLGFELARVRESTMVNTKDLILNHSLGLENPRPVQDIYFSDSDSDF